MPTNSIHFSPAIVTRADTSIKDCVQLMRKHNVGSVLVISDTAVQQLVGIFTERDLLRTIDQVQEGGFWNKPVRTVMSHPVRVLQASKLDQAGELMLKFGIRHMPIVVTDEKIKYRLVGVISMRDLFKDLVKSDQQRRLEGSVQKQKTKKPVIGVVTADPLLVRFFDELFSPKTSFHVKHSSIEELMSGQTRARAMIFDIDHLRRMDWLAALKEINRRPKCPFTSIVFNPTLHDAKTIGVLERLGMSKRFAVFAKPLPVSAVLQTLMPILR